jgi:hypothetical protein
MLANQRYSGKYELHGVEYDNIYPRIVDQAIVDKVREKLAQNKQGKQNAADPFLLKHKVFCGYCGKTMLGEGGSKNGHVYHYYKCCGKKNYHTDCPKSQIRKETLEDLTSFLFCILYSYLLP